MLIDFGCCFWKLALKIVKGDHMTQERCKYHICMLAAKYLNCNHMAMGMLQHPQLAWS